ncbi:MAG: hypothetical protein LBT09_09755 [Planctomycetaceae bacterium]|jgi:hypothetical protein|nr:hypothetical protein [Planctomycetaceae bacterium]
MKIFIFLILLLFEVGVISADDELRFPVLRRGVRAVSAADCAAADKLYQQAINENNINNGTEAMLLIVKAIELNPNHKEIRAMFGYSLHDGEWLTEWEIKKSADHLEHPRFGWIRADYVKRYEAGERMINSQRWVTVAEEANYRTKINNGWKIMTPHYDIVTNHSLEEGVARSRELEQLHDVWQLFIFGSLCGELRIKALFQKRATVFLPMQHKVTIYRNKNDYTADLMKIEPDIAASNGYYLPKQKRAYFHAVSPDMDKSEIDAIRRVLLHEGSHQLFNEPRSSSRSNELAGSRYNFWLVEGLAMFMETLRIKKDSYILGDITDERLLAAKYNAQNLKFYVPFGRIVKMGLNDFQRQKELPKLYSQSAAITHFLMFTEEGKYRKALLKLIKLVHNGTDKPESLAKLTDCTYEELDQKYKEFIKKIPDITEGNF